MNSQTSGNEPPTNPASSTHIPSQSAQVSIFDDVESIKNAVIYTLQNTVWPQRSKGAAQDLMLLIKNASSLKDIPKDNRYVKAEHRASLEQFIAVMVNVRQRLQEASEKYGPKERRFRGKIKALFTPMDRNKCIEVLESSRVEVSGAMASLPDHWTPELTTAEDQRGFHTSRRHTDTSLVAWVLSPDDEPAKNDPTVSRPRPDAGYSA
ncbi:hypothetical protein FRC01_003827 [Tulasnella sp. 417]|nr:hypothetical protein FRC01_003827 [Tulasnella sp. 417]